MAININAKTAGVGGIEVSSDSSGDINIQSGGSTKIAVTSAGAAVTGTLSATSYTGALTGATGLPKSALPTGSVLQVVSTTFSNASNIVSTSYTDVDGASLSITPTSSTSKILIMVNITCQIRYDATGHQEGSLQILRGASSIKEFGRVILDYYIPFSSTALLIGATPSITYLDSPATTSATTYKIQGKCFTTASIGRLTVNEAGSNSNSTITLMEIAA